MDTVNGSTPKFIAQFNFPELKHVKAAYNFTHHKCDKEGRPVYFDRLGDMRYSAMVNAPNSNLERLNAYFVWYSEATWHYRLPAASLLAGRYIGKGVYVMDLKGFALSKHFTSETRAFIQSFIKMASDNYPCATRGGGSGGGKGSSLRQLPELRPCVAAALPPSLALPRPCTAEAQPPPTPSLQRAQGDDLQDVHRQRAVYIPVPAGAFTRPLAPSPSSSHLWPRPLVASTPQHRMVCAFLSEFRDDLLASPRIFLGRYGRL